MTCGQLLNGCSLCQPSRAQKQAWARRHEHNKLGERGKPVPPPAYEGAGQLVKGSHVAPDGSVVVDYYQEDNARYKVRLCRGCLERVLAKQVDLKEARAWERGAPNATAS